MSQLGGLAWRLPKLDRGGAAAAVTTCRQLGRSLEAVACITAWIPCLEAPRAGPVEDLGGVCVGGWEWGEKLKEAASMAGCKFAHSMEGRKSLRAATHMAGGIFVHSMKGRESIREAGRVGQGNT
eukprot:182877-Chlamydomonas_euryale.AAC.1